MMQDPVAEIQEALEALELPTLISREDIKKQYRFLARKHHPDRGGDRGEMEKINHSYQLLMEYIDGFRYTFDEEEISRQYPGVGYAKQFRP